MAPNRAGSVGGVDSEVDPGVYNCPEELERSREREREVYVVRRLRGGEDHPIVAIFSFSHFCLLIILLLILRRRRRCRSVDEADAGLWVLSIALC